MREIPKRSTAAPIIAVVLLLLPVPYVGSYFALVLPEGVERQEIVREPGWPIGTVFVYSHRYHAHYRIGDNWSETLYAPLESLDRKVRSFSDAVYADDPLDVVITKQP
jgi:hypothetical protein